MNSIEQELAAAPSVEQATILAQLQILRRIDRQRTRR